MNTTQRREGLGKKRRGLEGGAGSGQSHSECREALVLALSETVLVLVIARLRGGFRQIDKARAVEGDNRIFDR